MAEGGHPTLGDEILEYPRWNWLHGSLEYVFASDFVHFVIAREDRSWRYRRLMGHTSPITPFNTTIQDVVEKVLRRESFYTERMFRQLVEPYDELTISRFNLCAAIMKEIYFGRINTYGGLLKYFCIVGHFSVWALKRNLDSAPYYALDIILGYMKEFLIQRNLNNMDDFWYALEREAGDALNIGDVTLIQDNTLQHVRNWQRRAEKLHEKTSNEVEDPAENAGATEGENSAETSAKRGPPLEQADNPASEEKIEVEKSESQGASRVPPEGATSVSEVLPPAEGATSVSEVLPPAEGATSVLEVLPPPAEGAAPVLEVLPPPAEGAAPVLEVLPPQQAAQPVLKEVPSSPEDSGEALTTSPPEDSGEALTTSPPEDSGEALSTAPNKDSGKMSTTPTRVKTDKTKTQNVKKPITPKPAWRR